jgi:hypothetical protein
MSVNVKGVAATNEGVVTHAERLDAVAKTPTK